MSCCLLEMGLTKQTHCSLYHRRTGVDAPKHIEYSMECFIFILQNVHMHLCHIQYVIPCMHKRLILHWYALQKRNLMTRIMNWPCVYFGMNPIFMYVRIILIMRWLKCEILVKISASLKSSKCIVFI